MIAENNSLTFLGILLVLLFGECYFPSANGADRESELIEFKPLQGSIQKTLNEAPIPGVDTTRSGKLGSSENILFAQAPILDMSGMTAAIDNTKNVGMSIPGFIGNTPSCGLKQIVTVIIDSPLDTRVTRIGDPVRAHLKEDFLAAGKKIVLKNANLEGRVVTAQSSRTLSEALVSKDRVFQPRGCLEIVFDRIVTGDGRVIPIAGHLTPIKRIDGQDTIHPYEVRVDKQGRMIKNERALSPGVKISVNAARAATIVPLPGGAVMNLAAMPATIGVAGAANPSFAFNKPVEEDVSHRRLKGFTYAFLTSLPGAALVQSVVEKGNQIILSPGQECSVDLAIWPDQAIVKSCPLKSPDIIAPTFGGQRLLPDGYDISSKVQANTRAKY